MEFVVESPVYAQTTTDPDGQIIGKCIMEGSCFKGAVNGKTEDGVEFSIPLVVHVHIPSSLSTESTDGVFSTSTPSTREPSTSVVKEVRGS